MIYCYEKTARQNCEKKVSKPHRERPKAACSVCRHNTAAARVREADLTIPNNNHKKQLRMW